MYTVGLPLLLVSAAPLGSALEGYGVRSKTEWAKTWGQRVQYVSSVALVVLGTTAAVWAGNPTWTAVGAGLTTIFVAIPVIKIWKWDSHFDGPISVLLKLSSVAVLTVASYSTTPLVFTLAACHLLPLILDPSNIAPL